MTRRKAPKDPPRIDVQVRTDGIGALEDVPEAKRAVTMEKMAQRIAFVENDPEVIRIITVAMAGLGAGEGRKLDAFVVLQAFLQLSKSAARQAILQNEGKEALQRDEAIVAEMEPAVRAELDRVLGDRHVSYTVMALLFSRLGHHAIAEARVRLAIDHEEKNYAGT